MPDLDTLRTLLIDGDGVLWLAEDGIPGSKRFFDVLMQRGIQWALLTNNSSRTAEQYVEKLSNFGVETTPASIFSSAVVTATYLGGRFKQGDALYVIGETGLKQTLIKAGFVVHDFQLNVRIVGSIIALKLVRSIPPPIAA